MGLEQQIPKLNKQKRPLLLVLSIDFQAATVPPVFDIVGQSTFSCCESSFEILNSKHWHQLINRCVILSATVEECLEKTDKESDPKLLYA